MNYYKMTADELQEALINLDNVIDEALSKDDESQYDSGIVNPYILALQLRREFIINTFIEIWGYNPDNLCTTSN